MARMTERLQPLGRLARLDPGPGRRRGDLRRLALWFAGDGDDLLLRRPVPLCLSTGAVVSYAKARAEGLGMTANVGIAERADRLVVVLVATGLDGLGVPYVQALALWFARRRQHDHRRRSGRWPCAGRPEPEAALSVRERADLPAVRRGVGGWCAGCPSGWPTGCSTLVADLVWRRRGRGGPAARGATCDGPGPDASDDELRALSRAGHALLPALLVRRVPAAGLEPRTGSCRQRPGRGRALPAATHSAPGAGWSRP